MAERNRNEYTFQLPERGLLGWIDRDKVEKICVNLLSNAFKYTPEGRGIHFSVSADTQQLTIIVSDEGIGMDQKAKERLFRRFENILGTTNFPSSGIGLSLIKELIDLMEGTIEVESTPGSAPALRCNCRSAATTTPACRMPSWSSANPPQEPPPRQIRSRSRPMTTKSVRCWWWRITRSCVRC